MRMGQCQRKFIRRGLIWLDFGDVIAGREFDRTVCLVGELDIKVGKTELSGEDGNFVVALVNDNGVSLSIISV